MIDANILQQQLNSLYLGLLLIVIHRRRGLQLSKRGNQKQLKPPCHRGTQGSQTFLNAFGFYLLGFPFAKCN
jgi:hypothetical protein